MLSVDERPEAAKNAQFCFSCLNAGHISRKCPKPAKCRVDKCQKKHHTLIHGARRVHGNPQPGEHSLSSDEPCQSKVLFQILPVTLHGPAASIDKYVMLDMGNICSLIRTDIARKAGLHGPKRKMTLNDIRQWRVFTSQTVSFEISL